MHSFDSMQGQAEVGAVEEGSGHGFAGCARCPERMGQHSMEVGGGRWELGARVGRSGSVTRARARTRCCGLCGAQDVRHCLEGARWFPDERMCMSHRVRCCQRDEHHGSAGRAKVAEGHLLCVVGVGPYFVLLATACTRSLAWPAGFEATVH